MKLKLQLILICQENLGYLDRGIVDLASINGGTKHGMVNTLKIVYVVENVCGVIDGKG